MVKIISRNIIYTSSITGRGVLTSLDQVQWKPENSEH